jgi:hypothetical protein
LSETRGILHITKLAAAQRQLDAAIRMTFAGEDALAIHTVAAAAFRLLRDLKEKRGHKKLLAELWRHGVLALAREFARGELQDENIKLFRSTDLWPLINSLAQQIKTFGINKKMSELQSLLSVNVPDEQERMYLSILNRGANFLKHADADNQASLSADELNTEVLISGACEAYLDLMGRWTPEMEVWIAACFYLNSDLVPPKGGPFRTICDHLRRIKPEKRNKECAKLVVRLKRLYARAKRHRPELRGGAARGARRGRVR